MYEVEKSMNLNKVLIIIFTGIIAIAGIVFAVIEYRYKKTDDTTGKIPFSNIGFENEDLGENILEREEKTKEKEDKLWNNEDEKSNKKGKHF